jgi:hypothetical protein
MALQVMVQYHDRPLTYNIKMQQANVFHLYLNEEESSHKEDYVPEKIVIRRKGKIWVSDADNNSELTEVLAAEIMKLGKANV